MNARQHGDFRAERNDGYRQPGARRHVPALETLEGRNAYCSILAVKAARQARVRRACVMTAVALIAVAGGLHYAGGDTGAAAAGVVAVFLLVFCHGHRQWTEADYYSIPGSRDVRGEHRCIKCGHRGIYRSGQYKSTLKSAECSKCKQHFWNWHE